MLTYSPPELMRDDRPAYRPFDATVVSIEELSPNFRRVRFTGPDFAFFGTDGLDQRVKVVFPVGGVTGVESGDADWYASWRQQPNNVRAPFRTYTVRSIDPSIPELVIDFVVHLHDGHPAGPASRWLREARVGDAVSIVGPDARSLASNVGIDWRPGDAVDVLLAGDETALPAICGIVESLSSSMRAHVLVELPAAADAPQLRSEASVSSTWIARDHEPSGLAPVMRSWISAHPEVLAPSLATAPQSLEDVDVDTSLLWDSPLYARGRFYAWLAGESALIKTLRRMLVSEAGVDRAHVAFMGYWRRGKSEAQE